MIKLGKISFNNPVLLAPMSGVTDEPFRSNVKKFGDIFTYTEMVASSDILKTDLQSIKKLQNSLNNNAIQIVGRDPNVMKQAAILCEGLGTSFIDINMGCPARKVVNSYCGAALMRDEELVKRLLDAVCNSVKIPVTLKMRLGWDNDNLNALKIARIAQESGVKMITVHARTKKQMFKDKARWKLVKIIKDSISIPVIINGDIVCENTAKLALEESNADGIMIGRGAYGAPWLPSKIKYYIDTGQILSSPSIEDQMYVLLNHYESLLSYYGINKGTRIARKHIQWATKNFSNSASFFQSICKEISPNIVKEHIICFFNSKTDFSMSSI